MTVIQACIQNIEKLKIFLKKSSLRQTWAELTKSQSDQIGSILHILETKLMNQTCKSQRASTWLISASKQTHAVTSDFGETTNQRLPLFAYGSASRIRRPLWELLSGHAVGRSPLLPAFVIYWPKLAADAEVVNAEHDACSALPISGCGLCSAANSKCNE